MSNITPILLTLSPIGRHEIIARFDGGGLSSNGRHLEMRYTSCAFPSMLFQTGATFDLLAHQPTPTGTNVRLMECT